MVVGAGGIGGMRDIGDPFDPRRGTSAPQPLSVPGMPQSEISLERLLAAAKSRGRLYPETNKPANPGIAGEFISVKPESDIRRNEGLAIRPQAMPGQGLGPAPETSSIDRRVIPTRETGRTLLDGRTEYPVDRASRPPVDLESLRAPDPSQQPRSMRSSADEGYQGTTLSRQAAKETLLDEPRYVTVQDTKTGEESRVASFDDGNKSYSVLRRSDRFDGRNNQPEAPAPVALTPSQQALLASAAGQNVSDPAVIEGLRYIRNQQIEQNLQKRYPDRYTIAERYGNEQETSRRAYGLNADGFPQEGLRDRGVKTSPWNRPAVNNEMQRKTRNAAFLKQDPEAQQRILTTFAGRDVTPAEVDQVIQAITPDARGTDLGFEPQTAVQALLGGQGPITQADADAFAKSGELERDTTTRNRKESADKRFIYSDRELTKKEQVRLESQDAAADKLLVAIEGAERDLRNAIDGTGKRSNQKRNKLDSEVFDRKESFTVPVVMGPQGRNAVGSKAKGTYRRELGAPQINTGFEEGRPRILFDTSDAYVASINPQALLPAEYASAEGLIRQERIVKMDESYKPGAYDKNLYVPSVDESSVQNNYIYTDSKGRPIDPSAYNPDNGDQVVVRDYDGSLRPFDDPSYYRGPESSNPTIQGVPMTVGQAARALKERHKTPLAHYTDKMVIHEVDDNGKDLYWAKADDGSKGTQLYLSKYMQQSPEDRNAYPAVTAYRVGSPNLYSDEFEPAVMKMFRALSGGRYVVDGIQDANASSAADRTRFVGGETLLAGDKAAFWDKDLRNLQDSMLQQAIREGDLPQGDSQLRNIVSLLASGSTLAPDDSSQPFVRVDAPTTYKGRPAVLNTADVSTRGAMQGRAQMAAEVAPQLADMAQERKKTAKQAGIKQRKALPERTAPYKANPKAQAEVDARQAAALQQRDADIAAAAQSPFVQAQNERAFADASAKLQAELDRANAVSEQNSLPPQSTSTGVMNTDDVSMLNAPEAPMPRDEPTPRQRQIAASTPSQRSNDGVNRAAQFAASMAGKIRRNPGLAAAAAAGGGLAGLGIIPWSPSEDQ